MTTITKTLATFAVAIAAAITSAIPAWAADEFSVYSYAGLNAIRLPSAAPSANACNQNDYLDDPITANGSTTQLIGPEKVLQVVMATSNSLSLAARDTATNLYTAGVTVFLPDNEASFVYGKLYEDEREGKTPHLVDYTTFSAQGPAPFLCPTDHYVRSGFSLLSADDVVFYATCTPKNGNGTTTGFYGKAFTSSQSISAQFKNISYQMVRQAAFNGQNYRLKVTARNSAKSWWRFAKNLVCSDSNCSGGTGAGGIITIGASSSNGPAPHGN